MWVHTYEFSRQNSSCIEVSCVGFETFIVSQDLWSWSSWHRCNKEWVPCTVLHNFLPKCSPVISLSRWFLVPHVKLENALTKGRTLKWFVWSFNLGELHWWCHRCMIDCFKHLLVKRVSSFFFKGDLEHHKGISQTLNTNTDWSMPHVRVHGLITWIEIVVNDSVEVSGNDLCHLVKLFKVKFTIWNISGKRDGSQVTHSYLIWGCVLNDFTAEIWTLNSSQVLVVWLRVSMIFVKHVGCSCLDLTINDSFPKFMSFDGLAGFCSFLLVLSVESFKLFSMALIKTSCLIGAEKCPVTIVTHSLHE